MIRGDRTEDESLSVDAEVQVESRAKRSSIECRTAQALACELVWQPVLVVVVLK
jgi:hypothetical protein